MFGFQGANEEFFMTDGLVVLCACPDEPTADRIARHLVSGHLAACVNRSACRSTYRWNGALQDEPETLLIIKTTTTRFEELERQLKALHPYEVPEIIALPVVTGSESYLAWIAQETRPTVQKSP
jgi:periplasmic divalent cation tolerance protein